jgi:L-seryl-tRNA(Ser) seleniumtransferase
VNRPGNSQKGDGRFYTRAVNGTGIFLHTGLGRAPFSERMVDALRESLRGYTVLEIDPHSGERSFREGAVVNALVELTGAEAGTVVNNNAAAVLLSVSVTAGGGEVIVSRGELIEIGGGFRMPDVLSCSGARLCEVGTTNLTRIEDYAAAITSETRLLMRVHSSNFRIVGEEAAPTRAEIVALGRKHSLPVIEDLGSGLISRFGIDCLEKEPTVREALAEGVDIVTFSGDKLLGGPQSGLILGRAHLIDAVRSNPLFRAVRPDKATLSLLEGVLRTLKDAGDGVPDLPFFRAFAMTLQDLEERAESLAALLRDQIPGARFSTTRTEAFAGSGSVPARPIPSCSVVVSVAGLRPQELARRLRTGRPPLYTTAKGEGVRIDVITLMSGDEEAVLQAFRSINLTGGSSGGQAARMKSRPST